MKDRLLVILFVPAWLVMACEGSHYMSIEERMRFEDRAPCHDGNYDAELTPTCPHVEHILSVQASGRNLCLCLFKRRIRDQDASIQEDETEQKP